MHCQLRKLNFENQETIDKLFISADNTIALTDKEGGVRLYTLHNDADEPSLIASYQDHKGPIIDVAFTSISHSFYILTCSYDRTLSLRSLDGQLFSYKEEDTAMGFFVSCAFVHTDSNVLRFLVGNSNGYVFDFDSRNGFEPVRHSLYTENIVSIASVSDDCTVVCVSNSAPRLYTDRSFQEYIQIESEGGKNKYKTARLMGDEHEASLLLINENNFVEVFRFNRGMYRVNREAHFQLNQKVLSASWNFSKHSANILVYDNENDGFEVRIVKEDLGKLGQWSIVEVKAEISE